MKRICCAGVSGIELSRAPESLQAASFDRHRRAVTANGNAQPPEAFESTGAIGAFGEIVDDRLPSCNRAHHGASL